MPFRIRNLTYRQTVAWIQQLKRRERVPQNILFAFNQPPREENTKYVLINDMPLRDNDVLMG